MSRANVELVRALIPQPGTDMAALFRDDAAFARMRDAVAPLTTDDFRSVVVFPAHAQTYAGLEGLRRNWLDWLEPWATYRITIDELIDLGERVVALTRNHGRRADMEIEVELVAAAIVTFRAGKVERWEDYANRAQALDAAGVTSS